MKKVVITCISIVVLASPVIAGTNLAWDDCLGGGGVVDKTVACANSGSSGTLNLSFVTPNELPQLAAIDAFLDVQAPSSVTSWWLTVPGGARWDFCPGFSESGACPGWFDGAPHGPLSFGPHVQQINPSRMSLRLTVVIAAGEEQSAVPGTEYLTGTLTLRNSSGSAGNAECLAGAVIGVTDLVLLQPGTSDIHMTDAEVSNCVTFRGGGSVACPLTTQGTTPVTKASWGSIKALYR